MEKKRITTKTRHTVILCEIATYVQTQRPSDFALLVYFINEYHTNITGGISGAHLTATLMRNDLKSPGKIHSTSCSIHEKTVSLSVHRPHNSQSTNTCFNKITILADTDPPPNLLHIHCIILCTRHLNNSSHSSHFNNYDNYYKTGNLCYVIVQDVAV